MTKHDIDMDELDNSPSMLADILGIMFVMVVKILGPLLSILAFAGGLLYFLNWLGLL